jgi:nitronate monooxygenase
MSWPRPVLVDLIGIKHPIIQAPMAGASTPALAAAYKQCAIPAAVCGEGVTLACAIPAAELVGSLVPKAQELFSGDHRSRLRS